MASPPVKKTSWLREKLSKKSSLGAFSHIATDDIQPFDISSSSRYTNAQRPSPDILDPFENGGDEEWTVLTIEKKKGSPSGGRHAIMDSNHTDSLSLQGANKSRKTSGGVRMSSPVMGRRSVSGPDRGIKSALKQDKKDAAPDRSLSAGSSSVGGSGAAVVARHSGRRKLLAVEQTDQRNGARSVSPNATDKNAVLRRKHKAISPGPPSSSPLDDVMLSAGGYQESAFSKVRDTLRIQKGKKKKKSGMKHIIHYSVPEFSGPSKYQDPFEAQPNFAENGDEPDVTGHEFAYISIPHNRPEYCDHCGQNAWGHHQVLQCTSEC